MKKYCLLSVVFFLGITVLKAQDSLQATIVLIGDAGQLTNGKQPVVHGVQTHVPLNKNTTVVYLGDNLYKTGLPDNSLPTYSIAKAPLDSQINIAGKSPVNVYFIPGNHDWANGGKNGYASILRVQEYIDILGNKYVTQLPRDGCPGPVEVNINDDITLVIMDSQWWLQENDKPGIESDCPFKTKAEVLTQLDDIFARNAKKLVIFACHHPFRSYGQHGGYFTIKQHIFPFTDINPKFYFPLPILGSAYPLTRAVFGTAQDLKHPFYQEMINDVQNVIKGHPNVIYVSGHEHTLQMIQDSGYNYIVSGSGSKTSRVSKSKNTLFASSDNGFVTLEISKNKNVRASFYTVLGDSVNVAFTKNILDFSKVPPAKKDSALREVQAAFKDSVIISASDKYKHPTSLQKTFLGKNYRKEWSTPVQLKVFNIRTEQGGFIIKSLGGGKQTKSLRLEDKNGKEWTLRTVDKDPEKELPVNFRGTLAQALVEDIISASNPYAPLIIPILSKAVNVPAANPKFFFVPDDPSLGYYRPLFANTVCLLEDRASTPDGSDTKSTSKIINKMAEDNDHHVNQPAVLKARLLDMLIGDFDRHPDQWKWGTSDTGKGKLYYPVPRDRDQAFFNSDGLFLDYLSKNQLPFLQGFKKRIPSITGLNYIARDFDRTFLNSLDKHQWKAIADSFQMSMTNAVIIEASSKYPPEIKATDSAKTVHTLMSRRDILTKKVLRYYDNLAKTVTVTGSNEAEYFHVQKDNDLMKLSVYRKDENSDSSSLMYRRSFSPKETKELILYGLNGDDKFEIDEDVASRIKIRIVGGKGKDSFDIKGNVRNTLYDLSTEKNVLLHTRRSDNDFSSDPAVLEYKSTGYQYNRFIFPQINIGYNVEDKLLLGLGFSSRTYGFRKQPYATNQKLSTLVAVNSGAVQAKYEGIFNQVLGKNDVIVNAEVQDPTLTNFFGYGNNSVFDKKLPLSYYRSRYKFARADVLLRKRYNDIFQLSAGPSYFHYWNDYKDNKGRILGNPLLLGVDSASLFSLKSYLGVKARFDINYINNEIFPTRGITWFTEYSNLRGLNNNSKNFSKINSDMTIYASVSDRSKVTSILRFGGGHIFSKQFEFFQALSLGSDNYLRGFRKGRFAGSSTAYGSGEVRVRIFRSKSYVLPGDVGLVGFDDIGRVWLRGEESDKWHNSYGGGLYFVPFNLVMISAVVGVSNEDHLFNFSVSTKLNISF
ncbi:MAG: metallophosphoesterase [Ferruginibacter sp.]